jgi:hypothetical protein
VKNLTCPNPEQQKVAQELIKEFKLKCCGIWVINETFKGTYHQAKEVIMEN